ncbi:MAG: sulfurtransferase [Deltaproteobacteria bacterium]
MNQKNLLKAAMVIFSIFISTLSALAGDLPAIVSTDWLAKNLKNDKLIVLDVRKVEYYQAGHIPGAVNDFYRAWSFKKADLSAEVPDLDDLFELVGSAGIRPDSHVVVVGKMDTWQERVHIARVACTLNYAGVANVSLLDGGHIKWAREGKPESKKTVKPKPITFKGQINRNIFVKKDYILKNMEKILLVDVREPAFFTGKKKAEVATKAGRIPGAVNLPTSWMFEKEGTFKKSDVLGTLAEGAIGKDRDREIITYCDTGTCCPTWHFILKEVLGYKRVYLYDGSIEEWTADPGAPVQTNGDSK